jgi:hypothetical protein
MRTNHQSSFFRKVHDLLSLPVDLGAVLRELFIHDSGSFPELLRRNSKPRELANRGKVHYVKGWMILIKP